MITKDQIDGYKTELITSITSMLEELGREIYIDRSFIYCNWIKYLNLGMGISVREENVGKLSPCSLDEMPIEALLELNGYVEDKYFSRSI